MLTAMEKRAKKLKFKMLCMEIKYTRYLHAQQKNYMYRQ